MDEKIVAVIIGASAALAGTCISQIFGLLSGWIDRRHQRDVRRRDRLEEMTKAVNETLAWIHTLGASTTVEEAGANHPPEAARRIAAIAYLYFPRLRKPAADYSNGLVLYYNLALSCFHPSVPASLGAQMEIALRESQDQNDPRFQPLLLRQALDDAISEEAQRYIHV